VSQKRDLGQRARRLLQRAAFWADAIGADGEGQVRLPVRVLTEKSHNQGRLQRGCSR